MANPYREEFNRNASRRGKTVDVTTPDPVRPAPTPWTAMDVGQGLGSAAGGLVRSFNEKDSALQKARSNIADAAGQAVGRGINRVEQVGTDFASGFRRGFSGSDWTGSTGNASQRGSGSSGGWGEQPNVLTQRSTTGTNYNLKEAPSTSALRKRLGLDNVPDSQAYATMAKQVDEAAAAANANGRWRINPQGSTYRDTTGIESTPGAFRQLLDEGERRRRAMEATPEYRKQIDQQYAREMGMNPVEVRRGGQAPEQVRFDGMIDVLDNNGNVVRQPSYATQSPVDAARAGRYARMLGVNNANEIINNAHVEDIGDGQFYNTRLERVFNSPAEAMLGVSLQDVGGLGGMENTFLGEGGAAGRYETTGKGDYYRASAGESRAKSGLLGQQAQTVMDQRINPERYQTKGQDSRFTVTKTGQIIDKETNQPIDQYGVLNQATGEVGPIENASRLVNGVPEDIWNVMDETQRAFIMGKPVSERMKAVNSFRNHGLLNKQ